MAISYYLDLVTDVPPVELLARIVRVRQALLIKTARPRFSFGDPVEARGERVGVVTDVHWDFERQEHFYFVAVEGQDVEARYASEDLIRSRDR
jgi:hypothetical protein